MGSRISFQQLLPGIKNPSACSTESHTENPGWYKPGLENMKPFFWTEFCHSLGLRRFCSSSVTATTGQTHERFLFSLDLSSESSPTSAASSLEQLYPGCIMVWWWEAAKNKWKTQQNNPKNEPPSQKKKKEPHGSTITLSFGTLEITSETFINVVKPNEQVQNWSKFPCKNRNEDAKFVHTLHSCTLNSIYHKKKELNIKLLCPSKF